MPLSFSPFVSCDPVVALTDEKNSRSACSGKGVGVSKMSVSTIDPFDEPKETLE